ncbi:MAG: N-acetylmuramic acid 6-phosphate etherase [Saprospiraceae bacterium]|nr:N-acetylmuramic acid 6-phosphate etherase [Saprospiraceae bacterium]
MERITESASPHRHLETWSVIELIRGMNQEDATVHLAVERALPQIEKLIERVVTSLEKGGRLFYIGAGTSGRLGILDASECPPTFGVPAHWVNGLIAGGDQAIRRAVEGAEDDPGLAWSDLLAHDVCTLDVVIGLAASGTTTYVVTGLAACREHGIQTGCITCNPESPLAASCDFPIEVVTGPEFISGSTRLKAGTAQKMVLNMITTATMIRLGRVEDNRMVDMHLSNQKLVERGTRILMRELDLTEEQAVAQLLEAGSVRKALLNARGASDIG